jgi:cation/acetate symporter
MFVSISTLAIAYYASDRSRQIESYASGKHVRGIQYSMVLAGEFISAASFLGVIGAIAIDGVDGLRYSIGFLCSYVILWLFIAKPIRKLAATSLHEAIALRYPDRFVQACIACGIVFITTIYMSAQFVGAGLLIHFLFNLDLIFSIWLVGIFMIIFSLIGNWIVTPWMQIMKTILLLGSSFFVGIIIFSRLEWQIYDLFNDHFANSSLWERIGNPGQSFANGWDALSLQLTLLLGTAGLPHILHRLFSVSSHISLRKSVATAASVIGLFYVITIPLGLSSVREVERATILLNENLAAIYLADALGGDFLATFLTAVAFTTILTVVIGLIHTTSNTLQHNLFASYFIHPSWKKQLKNAIPKVGSVIIGMISILLAIHLFDWNVALLVSLAFAMAASTLFPLMIFTFYWPRFHRMGAVACITTGALTTLALIVAGPIFMTKPWIHLHHPGIFSIPLAFLAGFIGSWIGSVNTSSHLKKE